MYKINSAGGITRVADGASIPPDMDNTDYKEYMAWVSSGNTTLPADPPSPQERGQAITAAIQGMLDAKAISLRYDSVLSARSYAGYSNPFQAEALRLAVWASACWAAAGVIEADVLAGRMALPTVPQALALMPGY